MNKKKILKRIGVTMLTIATGTSVIVGASFITGCSKQNEEESLTPSTRPIPDERGYYDLKELKAWGKLDDTYLTVDKIDYLADKIGVDNSYMYECIDSYGRFKHKNGEPINVYVNDNFADYKQTTLNAVDYLFGLIEDINPLYKYQITEDESIADLSLSNEEITAENGGLVVDATDGLSNYITREILIDIPQIEKSNEENKQEYEYYLTLHELLHQFGFNEAISHTQAHNNESIMNPISKMNHFPLCDYGNLLITYSQNVPESELDNLANTLKEKQKVFANNNKEKFKAFKSHIAHNLSNPGKKLKAGDIEFLKIEKQIKLFLDRNDDWYDYEIQITNDKYLLKTTMENGKTFTHKGDVLRLDNGVVILKNVHWLRYPIPNEINKGINEDLYIAKDSTGNYWLDQSNLAFDLVNLELKNKLGV